MFSEAFFETEVGTQRSVFNTQARTQEYNIYGPGIGDDEDLTIRLMVIFKTVTRLTMRKVHMNLTGIRMIQFT